LEALQYARPTLVTNAGFYRQLPDELVWKIDPDNEVSDILKQLEDICDHYPKALEKAAPGPAWIHANCRADQYAQQILDLCLDLLPTKATTQGRRQLEARAASLGGQMTRSLLNERIALASDSLFHHSSLLTNNAERDLRP
jgi:hypothetical protein